MNKAKLPENWIVKQSKNYPDHVYYFNVKTHKTTWVNPNKAADNEVCCNNNVQYVVTKLNLRFLINIIFSM